MNIQLIPLGTNHIDYVMSWINDPEIVFYFSSMKKVFSREEELEFIKNMIDSKNDEVFSVFDEGNYIGQVSINKIDRTQSKQGRLFLAVKKEYQGKGYAHEIIKRIQGIAFEEMGLNRLYLIVRPLNYKGLQLYHRCGFRQEGVLRELYQLNGEFIDMVLMAIIKRDWKTWWKEEDNYA